MYKKNLVYIEIIHGANFVTSQAPRIKELIDLDYKSKSGQIDLDIGLKTVLCKNC